MVIDLLKNSNRYLNLSERIAKAFNYINETDFSQIADGKYEIDSKNIFALVQEYDTKEISECLLEGHREYIDIQYILSGAEMIGFANLTDQVPVKVNIKDDYSLFECDSTLIKFEPGMFAIFFPNDLHMPGVYANQKSKV